jgi:hypothetical protein
MVSDGNQVVDPGMPGTGRTPGVYGLRAWPVCQKVTPKMFQNCLKWWEKKRRSNHHHLTQVFWMKMLNMCLNTFFFALFCQQNIPGAPKNPRREAFGGLASIGVRAAAPP